MNLNIRPREIEIEIVKILRNGKREAITVVTTPSSEEQQCPRPSHSPTQGEPS